MILVHKVHQVLRRVVLLQRPEVKIKTKKQEQKKENRPAAGSA
jgi:hypothetical protein